MAGAQRSLSARIVLGIAVLLALLGAYFVYDGVRWQRKFERWLVEEPVRLRLDLSHPGTFEAPFRQTCSVAHAQCVELEPANPEDLERLRAVAARTPIDIRLARKGETEDRALVLEGMPGEPLLEGAVRYARLHPVPNGDYVLTAVVRGDPESEPMLAHLVIRNELCGLEKLPGTVALVIGGVGIVLALVAALWAWEDPRRSVQRVAKGIG